MHATLRATLLSFAVLPLLAACDEEDVVSVRVKLREDLSGTVVTSGLVPATEPSALERTVEGATFEGRTQIAASSGRFAQVGALRVSDVEFSAGEGEGGFRYLQIKVPQGAASLWPDVFVPISEDDRVRALGALDPSGQAKDAGSYLKIEIECPSKVVSSGLVGKVKGTKSTTDGSTATLILPIQASKSAPDSLVWHLTWQR